jgi:hypothetical protein
MSRLRQSLSGAEVHVFEAISDPFVLLNELR